MKRRFDKMHGLGNDFVIVDAREQPFEVTPSLARAIADRRTGVGCDQLIVLEPSESADLKMRIWNSDGGEVEACGNATRCVVQLTGATRIDSDGGTARRRATRVARLKSHFRSRASSWDEIPLAYRDGYDGAADGLGRTGTSPWRSTSAIRTSSSSSTIQHPIPMEELGPTIENDAVFPERINVNVALRSRSDGIRLRTWERGAGLTLACGTGACATAVAAIAEQARHIAGEGRHDAWRIADHQLGARRADPHARRGDARVQRRARPRGAAMSVETITLGCRLNFAESETIARAAPTDEDWIVVNSCAVTNEAVRQTRQAIRRAHRRRPSAKILVTGCAAELDPASFTDMPEVARVVGNSQQAQQLDVK